MRLENPTLFNVSPTLFLLLSDSSDFGIVACEDMPDCDCGHLHLIPPLALLVYSEFLEESEAQELEQRCEALDECGEREDCEACEQGIEEQARDRVIEILEECDARAVFEAAALRASMGIRLQGDDPPADLFASGTTEGED